MPSKIYSCALSGIEAYGVEIEVDIGRGIPRFTVVGLGDTAIQESRERVRSALLNSGAEFPRQRKVINLAPASTRKAGPAFDLPMAIGLMADSGQLPAVALDDALFVGELALDGSLRATHGILACARFAAKKGFQVIYVPAVNAAEAALVDGVTVYPVGHLRELIQHLRGALILSPFEATPLELRNATKQADALPLAPGRAVALRALAIAAAGGHHVLLYGPPGSGKTWIAKHLPRLLPRLSKDEVFELTQLYSVAGRLPAARPLITERPFRSLHHTASVAAVVGGGPHLKPGEISLAHRGVLFLDEMPEFRREVLETLRQPLEERSITLSRAPGTWRFPAHFTLVGAMNPCPCGYFGDLQKKCVCSAAQRRQYSKKLSGPLLDRMDLFIKTQRLSFEEVHGKQTVDLQVVRSQIEQARTIQARRLKNFLRLNSDLSTKEVQKWCVLSPSLNPLLRNAVDKHQLSTRGYFRVLKLARTLADMEGAASIGEAHLLEALSYRPPAHLP